MKIRPRGRSEKEELESKGKRALSPALIRTPTLSLWRPSTFAASFRRSHLAAGKTRRRATSFRYRLIFMNRAELCHPCRGLILLARMPLMQTKQLKGSCKGEEQDRRSKEGAQIEV